MVSGWMRWQQVSTGQEHEEEEETLTRYESKQDLAPAELPFNGSSPPTFKDPRLMGWEFKIVRSQQDLFRDPVVLQRLCEEESHAGWILLEKLDDRRIRFKRPIALREIIKSDMMAIDPYRSHYGASGDSRLWVMAIVGVLLLTLPAYLGFMLVSATLNKPPAPVNSIQKGSPITPPKTTPE